MVASVSILAVSTVLLVYWFRYTCLLILRTQPARDFSASLAEANNLEFPEIQSRGFRNVSAGELASLENSLARDYRLLTYLLGHTAGLDVGGFTLEQRLLMADFMVMRLFAKLTNRVAASGTRAALDEMSQILNHLANAMGERVYVSSRG
jgi:hypothetical protein